MSDDFDSLFDSPPPAAAPAKAPAAAPAAPAVPTSTAVATVPPEEVEAAREAPALWLALYKPGADVEYEGERHTVNHVHISRKGLFVRLKEKEGVVPAEKVNVALTRVVLPMQAYQPPPALLPGPARTK
ncbi:hypothetical protein os1_26060 [Comamonadaceae bacterium OS-1]|nr:hypothetical protein os1_26060 [Comamonadaceae bacterium OS-1]